MCFLKNVVILSLISLVLGSQQLPSYMKKCKFNATDTNECIANSANVAVPYIIKGDKSLKIPKLDPLKVTEVVTESGQSLRIVLHNSSTTGINNLKVQKAKLDFDKLTLNLVNFIPRLEILGDYEINGKILILPIQGKGPANITIVDGTYYYDLVFKHVTKKDGKKYYQIQSHTLKYDPKKVIYQFDNLFNGDEILGKQMNLFMNENWKDLQKDLGSGVGETMAEVTSSILRAVFNVVAVEDMWEYKSIVVPD